MNRRTCAQGATLAAVLAFAAAGGLRSARADQAAVTIALPAQTTQFRPAPGVELAQHECLTCHASEYVTSQPALSKSAWTKEITKMRTAYGASIPDADTDALVRYLLAQNPTATK